MTTLHAATTAVHPPPFVRARAEAARQAGIYGYGLALYLWLAEQVSFADNAPRRPYYHQAAAQALGCAKVTVKRQLAALQRAGLITVRRWARPTQSGLWVAVVLPSPTGAPKGHPAQRQREGSLMIPRGITDDPSADHGRSLAPEGIFLTSLHKAESFQSPSPSPSPSPLRTAAAPPPRARRPPQRREDWQLSPREVAEKEAQRARALELVRDYDERRRVG